MRECWAEIEDRIFKQARTGSRTTGFGRDHATGLATRFFLSRI